jgi:hypothetical protein
MQLISGQTECGKIIKNNKKTCTFVQKVHTNGIMNHKEGGDRLLLLIKNRKRITLCKSSQKKLSSSTFGPPETTATTLLNAVTWFTHVNRLVP